MNGPACFNELDLHDADERGKFEAQVQSMLSGKIRDFRILVLSKGLILRGQARTYYAKQLAQHAVMEATPIPLLANQIQVE